MQHVCSKTSLESYLPAETNHVIIRCVERFVGSQTQWEADFWDFMLPERPIMRILKVVKISVFGGKTFFQRSRKNFLLVILPWCGYSECHPCIVLYARKKIRLIRHSYQKILMKTRKKSRFFPNFPLDHCRYRFRVQNTTDRMKVNQVNGEKKNFKRA